MRIGGNLQRRGGKCTGRAKPTGAYHRSGRHLTVFHRRQRVLDEFPVVVGVLRLPCGGAANDARSFPAGSVSLGLIPGPIEYSSIDLLGGAGGVVISHALVT